VSAIRLAFGSPKNNRGARTSVVFPKFLDI
jgi:hypothetical protein